MSSFLTNGKNPLIDNLLKEVERVQKIDRSLNVAGAQPLILSILYMLRQFDGARTCTMQIEMRRDHCKSVLIVNDKPMLSEELAEVHDYLVERNSQCLS